MPHMNRRGRVRSKRAAGVVLLALSAVLVAVGVPVMLIGGIWMVPGAIATLGGAGAMGFAFAWLVESGD